MCVFNIYMYIAGCIQHFQNELTHVYRDCVSKQKRLLNKGTELTRFHDIICERL
jgi:hypothetical protein